jgi:hypothetical protein
MLVLSFGAERESAVTDTPMTRGAAFSRCRTYRYHLWREWNPDGLRMLLIMLNPSLADQLRDDPTITKSIAIARNLGCGRLDVGNLAAFRSPHPADLRLAADPVGPGNDRHLARMLANAGMVVCAWGANASLVQGRVQVIARLVKRAGVPTYALKLTNDGFPSHPLARGKGFIPTTVQPIPFAL